MNAVDLALLLVRCVLGAIFVIHGGQKLFGWLNGPRMKGTIGMITSFNVAHPIPLAWMVALSEFIGGLLVLIGLLTPLGAALIASSMITAIAMVHYKKGLFNTAGGYEFNLSLATMAVALILAGAGAFSLDYMFGIAHPLDQQPWWAVIILVLIIVGGIISTEWSRYTKERESGTNSSAVDTH